MTEIDNLLDSYGEYHQDSRNRFIHLFGIPIVTFSLFVFLAWFRLAFLNWLSAATLFFVGILGYYAFLDRRLAVWVAALFTPLLLVAERLVIGDPLASIKWFFITFIGGWALQLLGHAFEGRKPALADNLFQALVAPLFVAVEIKAYYQKHLRRN